MTTFPDIAADLERAGDRAARRGRSATPAPGSRCSRSPASRATPTRRSPTPRRCTASPGSRRRSRCTSRGTGRRLRRAARATPTTTACSSARSTRTRSRTTTTSSAACATPTRASARKAIDHLLECVDIMDATGSRDLKLWLRRRHQLPGPGRHARPPGPARRVAARRSTRASAPTSGWCSSTSSSSRRSTRPTCRTGAPRYAHCVALGERAVVCLDTGHHAPGTNIEFIVMQLLRLGQLGAFDFNSRFYADDDLMVGAADPFQLFRIMYEVVRGGGYGRGQRRRVHARPVPQHRAEDPRPDPLGAERAGGDGQGAARRPRRRWPRRSAAGDVLGANAVLMDAFNTDVRAAAAPSCASEPRPRPPTRWPPTPRPATRSGSSPSASAAPRPAGARELTVAAADRRRTARPLEPARRRPAQHQLRRRQHLGQGHRRSTRSPARRSSCCG